MRKDRLGDLEVRIKDETLGESVTKRILENCPLYFDIINKATGNILEGKYRTILLNNQGYDFYIKPLSKLIYLRVYILKNHEEKETISKDVPKWEYIKSDKDSITFRFGCDSIHIFYENK